MEKKHSIVIFTTASNYDEAEARKKFLESLGHTVTIKQYDVKVSDVTNLTMIRAMIDTFRNGDYIHCNACSMKPFFSMMDIKLYSMKELIGMCTMKELYLGNVRKSDFDKYISETKEEVINNTGSTLNTISTVSTLSSALDTKVSYTTVNKSY